MTRRCNIRKHLRLRQPAPRKRQRLSHQETTPSSAAVSFADVAVSVSLSAYCLRYLLSLRSPSLFRDFRFLLLSLYPPSLFRNFRFLLLSLYPPSLFRDVRFLWLSLCSSSLYRDLLLFLLCLDVCNTIHMLKDHPAHRLISKMVPHRVDRWTFIGNKLLSILAVLCQLGFLITVRCF